MAGEEGRGPGRNTPPHAFMYILSRWRLGIFLPSNETVPTHDPSTGFQAPLCSENKGLGRLGFIHCCTVAIPAPCLSMNGGNTLQFHEWESVAWCVELCCQAAWKGRLENAGAWTSLVCFLGVGTLQGPWVETGQRPLLFPSCSQTTQAETPLGGWPSRWNHLNFTMSLRKEPGTYMF